MTDDRPKEIARILDVMENDIGVAVAETYKQLCRPDTIVTMSGREVDNYLDVCLLNMFPWLSKRPGEER